MFKMAMSDQYHGGSEMMAISAQQTKIHVAIATWEWGSYFDQV